MSSQAIISIQHKNDAKEVIRIQRTEEVDEMKIVGSSATVVWKGGPMSSLATYIKLRLAHQDIEDLVICTNVGISNLVVNAATYVEVLTSLLECMRYISVV